MVKHVKSAYILIFQANEIMIKPTVYASSHLGLGLSFTTNLGKHKRNFQLIASGIRSWKQNNIKVIKNTSLSPV